MSLSELQAANFQIMLLLENVVDARGKAAKLRSVLLTVLDAVDYTNGAVLPLKVLEQARAALKECL